MHRKSLIYFCLTAVSALFSTNTLQAGDVNDLLASERNNVEIFQKFSPKVVYIHRLVAQNEVNPISPSTPSKKIGGAGSGIIWDDKGHIVTNFHVVRGAQNLAVSFGKLTVSAKVVGVDPRKDIAVLVVSSPKALALLQGYQPFATIHTKELMVGQKTLAIGNPFGLDHSLTTGVISALGREMPGAGGVTIHDMVQTDASINPGNSGGPLLDSKGRLIGLNTAIYSNTGSSAGIGFAVPSDDIERIVPQIIQKGHATLAGIGIVRMPEPMAASLGVAKGVLVADVIPKTPAQAAKLQGTYRDTHGRIHLGDVIVALNGHPVANYDELYNVLAGIKVQDEVTVTLIRQGKSLNLKMKTIDIAGID
jgi:S1-C subfamily serine protease